MSNLSDFIGGRMVQKFELLTSGTTWAVPSNILGDTIYVSAIAGGESHNSTGPVYGQGGEFIQKWPITVITAAPTNITYAIGAAGTGTAGANGGNTTFGSLTLLGGGVTNSRGCPRGDGAGNSCAVPPGPYGSNDYNASPDDALGGGGLDFGGTCYGHGGNATNNDGGAGAILIEWWEKA